jgi:NADPH-dependent curcumin reductase CurA
MLGRTATEEGPPVSDLNRQWLLRARPVGMVKESDFELHEAAVPSPGRDEALVRVLYLAFEPAMRGWMEDRASYIPPVGIGEVMRGMTVGEVLASNRPELAPGDLVSGMCGWQEYCATGVGLQKLPAGVDPTLALSVFGATGLTAYFGIEDIGRPKAGETVVVSGAAGATGSIAGQIARIHGARAIGIAGGRAKCDWLTAEAHFDAAIDYKSDDVGAKLAELCPDGVDVYFDNVGGEILDAVLARIARGARVVLCGAISGYNLEKPPPGPGNYFNLVLQRGRMEGFILLDHVARFGEAGEALAKWLAEGRIAHRVDVQEGFENAPRTFLRLFKGENFGKQLLQLG